MINTTLKNSGFSHKTSFCKTLNNLDVDKKGLSNFAKADTVSFQGSLEVVNTDYNFINGMANQLYAVLSQNISDGIDFMSSTVPELRINYCENLNAGAFADIQPDKTASNRYVYVVDFVRDLITTTIAMHEFYHVLQFEYDPMQEFVKVRKIVPNNTDLAQKSRERCDTLTSLLVNNIFIPVYSRSVKRIRQLVNDYFRKDHLNVPLKVLDGSFIDELVPFLESHLAMWFLKLPEDNDLRYLISQTDIEIKAHEYCLSKNLEPFIVNSDEINSDKLRDLLAIKIYTELKDMAQKALDQRVLLKGLNTAA